MIRITIYSTDDIECVSATSIQKSLKAFGIKAEGVNVTKLSQKQYDKGMRKH
jgi:hypothetical protein